MKVVAGLALGVLLLMAGLTCGYAEWTWLRCLRCGKPSLSRQLRFGPDILFAYADWAQHSIPLWFSRLDSGARLEPHLHGDFNDWPAPFPTVACDARGHLWRSEQVYKRGVALEYSSSSGMSERMYDPLTRGIDRWSDPAFREFCLRSEFRDRLGEVLLPGDALLSPVALTAWDARLGSLCQAYERSLFEPSPVGWKPAYWRWVADGRDEMRFASLR
jgi:hypothetical protein